MIIFSQKCLRQALSGLRVLKVNKQKLEILRCVLIRGIGETVVFEATNLDEHLSFEARGETDTPGSQLVPYDLLNDALMSSDPDSTVTINPGHDLSYIAGGSKLSIPLPELKPEDWPPTPAAAGQMIPLPAGVLGSMVEAQGCASTDSKRYSVIVRRAHKDVASAPAFTIAANGRVYQNPAIRLLREFEPLLMKYETEMGMTAAARSKIDIGPKEKPDDSFARKFLMG